MRIIVHFVLLSLGLLACKEEATLDESAIRFCEIKPDADRISEAKKLRFDVIWENGNFQFHQWDTYQVFESCLQRSLFTFEDSLNLTVEILADLYYDEENDDYWLYPIGGTLVECLPVSYHRKASETTLDEVFYAEFIADSSGNKSLPLCVEEKPTLRIREDQLSGSLGANTFDAFIEEITDTTLIIRDFTQSLGLHPSPLGNRFEEKYAELLGERSMQADTLYYQFSADTLLLTNSRTKDRGAFLPGRD